MQKKFPNIAIENVLPNVSKALKLTDCNEIFSIEVATDDVSTYLEISFKNFLTNKANYSEDKIFIVDEFPKLDTRKIDTVTL